VTTLPNRKIPIIKHRRNEKNRKLSLKAGDKAQQTVLA
jgi:hypothetical protein